MPDASGQVLPEAEETSDCPLAAGPVAEPQDLPIDRDVGERPITGPLDDAPAVLPPAEAELRLDPAMGSPHQGAADPRVPLGGQPVDQVEGRDRVGRTSGDAEGRRAEPDVPDDP